MDVVDIHVYPDRIKIYSIISKDAGRETHKYYYVYDEFYRPRPQTRIC